MEKEIAFLKEIIDLIVSDSNIQPAETSEEINYLESLLAASELNTSQTATAG